MKESPELYQTLVPQKEFDPKASPAKDSLNFNYQQPYDQTEVYSKKNVKK